MIFDVVIVGGGPVGLAAALQLSRLGLSVCLIEARSFEMTPSNPLSPRVSALCLASCELLKTLGAWPSEKYAKPYCKMRVWDEQSEASLALDSLEAGLGELGWMVNNHAISGALFTAILKDGQVKCCEATLRHAQSLGTHWHLKLSTGEALATELLVGADGVNSLVRRFLGIDLVFAKADAMALVFTLKADTLDPEMAYQRFLENGPVALLPLALAPHYAVVWSMKIEQAKAYRDLSGSAFLGQLKNALAIEHFEPEVISPIDAILLKRQQVRSCTAHQAVLLGDAAHSIHPLAGFGVNLGFSDVAALTRTVSKALSTGRKPHEESVLKMYSREQYATQLAMGAFMESLNTLFSSKRPANIAVRAALTQAVDVSSFLKSYLIQKATGMLST